MIDMIKMKVTNLERVTYLVLDEADRMFDMGFEPQVRSICDHVRPDRQSQLYSATFKKRIEKLARDVLTDPIKVVQGEVGVVAENVSQNVKVVPLGGHKWQWLVKSLVEFMSEGSVLVFVTKKQNCEELAHNLKVKAEIDCRCLQGDMFQTERNEIISSFKKKEFPVLVATDVAARGLDIPHIRNVINFDVARYVCCLFSVCPSLRNCLTVQRYRHSHTPGGQDGAGGTEGHRAHSRHRQRQGVRWPPREEPGELQ